MRKTIALAVLLLAIIAGCENAGNKSPLVKKIDTLNRQKMQLRTQLDQSQTQNKQLKKQLQLLSGLEPNVRLENLYELQKVRLTRYTNLYDKDKDGKAESLIVYIQPIDEEGDIVKATGTVYVQLWDLNKKDGQPLLGQWHVEPDELKKLWFATLITINYRLTFDIAGITDGTEEALTVKVTFTDYLTGRVFKEQKVIKPMGS